MNILNLKNLKDNLKELQFKDSAIEELSKVAEKINSNDELTNIFKNYYDDVIQTEKWRDFWNIEDPDEKVKETFDKQYSLFYLLCYLERLPQTKAKYEELKIPYEIYINTLCDIGIWLNNWYEMHGFYCFNNFGWIWRHLTADIFRIGRLQYQAVRRPDSLHAFKNRKSSLIAILGESGMNINKDGDMTGVGENKEDVTDFTTKYIETEKSYIGNLITPLGKAKKEKTRLLKREWECILGDNDYILELHIPRGKNLLPEDCKKSYELATQFYNEHFSDIKIKGLSCHTWMFTPQLQDILPDTSNLVKFQREFYLYPHAGSHRFLWNFVFNEVTTVENAPQDTHLRRKAVEYVKENKLLFDLKGYCLHGFEEWGNQKYFNSKNNEIFQL